MVTLAPIPNLPQNKANLDNPTYMKKLFLQIHSNLEQENGLNVWMGWDGIYCGYGVATALKIVHWSIPFLTGPYASLSFKFFTEIIFFTLWLHWGSIQHCWGSKSVKGCLKKIETHKIICLSQNYLNRNQKPFFSFADEKNWRSPCWLAQSILDAGSQALLLAIWFPPQTSCQKQVVRPL